MKTFTTKMLACCCFASALLAGINGHAQIINTFAGNGYGAGQFTGGYTGDGGPATAAEFMFPFDAAADNAGNIYIADAFNNVIRKVNASGVVTTVAGNGVSGYSGDGGPAIAANLNTPIAISVDAHGNLLIADTYNNVIRKVDTGGTITTIIGSGFGAGTYSGGYTGDGGQATAAELNMPYSVVTDAIGNMYVTDEGNEVVRKVDTSGVITTIVGNGTGGYNGDSIAATAAELFTPQNAVLDSKGNLYISDYANNRVRKVDTAGIITTFAGDGTALFGGNGGPATAAQIHGPAFVIVDAADNVYITDQGDAEIRKVDASGNINAVVGDGTGGYMGDGGPALDAEIDAPQGIGFDPSGNLYIADVFNNVIRVVNFCGNVTAGTITDSAGSSSFCTSANITLSLSGETTSPDSLISYQWKSSADGVNYTNVGTDTITYATGTITATTYYKTVATCLSTGLVDSTIDTIVINANVTPTVSVTANPGTTVAAGVTVTFTANPTNGGTTPTYQWQDNGVNVNGATNSTYVTNQLTDSDVVTCIMHSSLQCASPDSVGSTPLVIHINTGVGSLSSNTGSINVYPNPNKGTFSLEGNVYNSNTAQVQVLNVVGQVVYNATVVIQGNHLKQQISLSNDNASGVYEVRIKANDATNILRFVMEK